MLRVTVELFPRGSVSHGKILSQIFIINNGSGNTDYGNYVVHDNVIFESIEKFERKKGHKALVGKVFNKLARKENT